MAVACLVTILGGAAVAQVLSSLEHSRGYAAARFLGARFGAARMQAVSRGAAVALRFEPGPHGVSFTVFQDGNRNGVRTADIGAGVDRAIEPPTILAEHFPGVDIGIAPGSPVSDPIQIGSTNLLTFTPAGTSTSGTVYIRDGQGTQWGVRVLGATGRIRVLRYDATANTWRVAQ